MIWLLLLSESTENAVMPTFVPAAAFSQMKSAGRVIVNWRRDIKLVEIANLNREKLLGIGAVERGCPNDHLPLRTVSFVIECSGEADDSRIGVDRESARRRRRSEYT